MNNEQLLWVAQQAVDKDAYIDGAYSVICSINTSPLGLSGAVQFDIESDTLQAAYFREKVVKWTGAAYAVDITSEVSAKKIDALADVGGTSIKREDVAEWCVKGPGMATVEYDTYEQAVEAACIYVWGQE